MMTRALSTLTPVEITSPGRLPVTWLDAIILALDLISESNGHLRGLTMNEYVPLFSILLLAGGAVFWLMLVFLFFVGAFRLVRKGVWAVIDLLPAKSSGGSLPHVE